MKENITLVIVALSNQIFHSLVAFIYGLVPKTHEHWTGIAPKYI